MDDPDRALILVFAYVHLPWFGPEPKVKGLSACPNCSTASGIPSRPALSRWHAGWQDPDLFRQARMQPNTCVPIWVSAAPCPGDG